MCAMYLRTCIVYMCAHIYMYKHTESIIYIYIPNMHVCINASLNTNEYISQWHQNSSELGLNKMHLICNSTLTTEQFRTYNYLYTCASYSLLQPCSFFPREKRKKAKVIIPAYIYTHYIYIIVLMKTIWGLYPPPSPPTHRPLLPWFMFMDIFCVEHMTALGYMRRRCWCGQVVSALACACFQPQFEQHRPAALCPALV